MVLRGMLGRCYPAPLVNAA